MLGLAAHAAACEKTVRWNDDPPFSQREANGEISGITVDQVRDTLRRLGCTARLLEMPWARALAELEAGRLDILPDALQTAERARFAHFSMPGLVFVNALFISTDALKAKRYAKLSELLAEDVKEAAMTLDTANAIIKPTQVVIEAFDAAMAGRRPGEQQGTVAAAQKPGRNEPCPCGSGKKFKKCHGGVDATP